MSWPPNIERFSKKYPEKDFGDVHVNRPCQIDTKKDLIVKDFGWHIYPPDSNGLCLEDAKILRKDLGRAIRYCEQNP